METNDSMKYLSLKTAAQLYGYTRDHLGLMIRQNKLKGKKLGNYYITTNEWVLEYVKNYADPSHSTAKNKLSNRFISEILSSKKEIKYFGKHKDHAQKSNDSSNSFIEEPKTKLQEEILKELSRSQGDETLKIEEKFQPNIQDKVFFPPFESPYLVLPIRKMEDIEREQILNLLRHDEKETESA